MKDQSGIFEGKYNIYNMFLFPLLFVIIFGLVFGNDSKDIPRLIGGGLGGMIFFYYPAKIIGILVVGLIKKKWYWPYEYFYKV